MSGNKLKIIACITMLIDHIGFLLFPKVMLLRYIGRISLPLFAFLIAEGCLHTRSKLRYFLSIFSMAIFCQSVYVIEDLLDGRISSLYLNILFTFAFSILICCAYIKWSDAAKNNSKTSVLYFTLFLCKLVFSQNDTVSVFRIPANSHRYVFIRGIQSGFNRSKKTVTIAM